MIGIYKLNFGWKSTDHWLLFQALLPYVVRLTQMCNRLRITAQHNTIHAMHNAF